MAQSCQLCSSSELHEVGAFTQFPRVTSDSKPFPQGGHLFFCETCGLTQKSPDQKWLNEISEIYSDYQMYSDGSHDQMVFDKLTGVPSGRCSILMNRLVATNLMSATGDWLDFGVGGGAMLAACSSALPNWRLYGLDLDNRKADQLKNIPNFDKLFTSDVEDVDRMFSVVSLVHSLEHLVSPKQMLQKIKRLILPDGYIFIQVNDLEATPYDLVVADHLCHFSKNTLTNLIEEAGYDVILSSQNWIVKEITILAKPTDLKVKTVAVNIPYESQSVQKNIGYLTDLIKQAVLFSKAYPKRTFGIFGTSIAATWISAELGDRVMFYVDEDKSRIGSSHLGKCVLGVSDIPENAIVFLPFVHEVANAIAKRLEHLQVTFVIPEIISKKQEAL